MMDLYIGRKRTGVSIKPDAVRPKMWRIHQGERVSDMVNISRAKDAAIGWAIPNGGQAIKQIRWVRAETCPEAGSSAFEQVACPLLPPTETRHEALR
jgi:hypothetical protein